LALPSIYIWTEIAAVLSGSITQPLAVTLLGAAVTASTEPKGLPKTGRIRAKALRS
jgi:hypothetical protein